MLTIDGVDYLGGTEHRMLPDMIEVGSFIGLAAMTKSDITIKGAGIEHLGIIPEKFQQLGIKMNFNELLGKCLAYLIWTCTV
jgi:UDP-N-acetylglucosamine 1-carboxyvinyltransferase